MAFEGYNYKIRLNIAHTLSLKPEDAHFHTLEAALLLEPKSTALVAFEKVEKEAEDCLSVYGGQLLNEVPPFDTLLPTIENIGEVFFEKLEERLDGIGFRLIRLEISETPTRSYVTCGKGRMDERLQRNAKILHAAKNISRRFSEVKAVPAQKQFDLSASEKLPEEAILDSVDEEILLPQEALVKKSGAKFLLCLLLLLACAVGLVLYIGHSGFYPLGFDIYGHLFKADMLYDSMRAGDFYPLHTPWWYNGMQPFRYWPPLPYYVLASLEFLTGGDVMAAFLIFIGVAFFIGAAGWVLWGIRTQRIALCTFLGALWFFLPDNARVFFSEGNFPRMVIAAVVPYLFYYIWSFLRYRKKRSMIPIMLFMCVITMCHAMLGAMVGIASFVFLLFYSLSEKTYKPSAQIIVGMLLSYALCGIWLLPALSGGIMSMDSTEIMTSLSTKLADSLNPLARLSGDIGLYYYGLPLFAAAVLGLFVANRRCRAGFISALLFLFGTTTALTPIIVRLPLSSVLWMRRFTLIAYALFFLSLIEWRELKKGFVFAFCALFILDAAPSFNLEMHLSKFIIPATASTQALNADTYSFSKAKEITRQRVSLMDLSAFGPFPSYYFSAGEEAVQYSFGWAWQGAATASNIVMLNTALEDGYFNYLFDRSVEMGDDTVIFRKETLPKIDGVFEKLQEAAALSGYTLAENGAYSYVYTLSAEGTFGVVSDYDKLAIGKSAGEISLLFPEFQGGDSTVLDEYTLEALSGYEEIYLSGFTYSSKKAAEALVTALTERGVRVVIDMNRIPVNPVTNRSEFMGVTAQSVTFDGHFPTLMYQGKTYLPTDFSGEFRTWNAVYLEDLDRTDGYGSFEEESLAFSGWKGNENTVFMGFNLLYHAMETSDSAVTELMRSFFRTNENLLPAREIVPLDIVYKSDTIEIEAPVDGVNTTLAYQDNFTSEQRISSQNNLLVVGKGRTVIHMVYPKLLPGALLSVLGFAGTVFFLWLLLKKDKISI